MSDPSEGGVLFVITASMIREIEEALSTRPFSSIRAAKWSTVPNLGNPRLSNRIFRAKSFIEPPSEYLKYIYINFKYISFQTNGSVYRTSNPTE